MAEIVIHIKAESADLGFDPDTGTHVLPVVISDAAAQDLYLVTQATILHRDRSNMFWDDNFPVGIEFVPESNQNV
jgi:hypothetical protein